MNDFVTLSCPSCGGRLHITDDIDRFACANCGNEHIVRRNGGIISIVPITEELRKMKTGIDRTASELAIKRLKEELGNLQDKADILLAEIYEDHPKDYLINENDIDIVLTRLEQDILQMQKFSRTIIGKISGTTDKFEILKESIFELKQLHDNLTDKEAQLRKHEQVVSEV